MSRMRRQPPWAEAEILHKLEEADKSPGPRGAEASPCVDREDSEADQQGRIPESPNEIQEDAIVMPTSLKTALWFLRDTMSRWHRFPVQLGSGICVATLAENVTWRDIVSRFHKSQFSWEAAFVSRRPTTTDQFSRQTQETNKCPFGIPRRTKTLNRSNNR